MQIFSTHKSSVLQYHVLQHLRCLLVTMINDTNSEHEESGHRKLFIDEIKRMTSDLACWMKNFRSIIGLFPKGFHTHFSITAERSAFGAINAQENGKKGIL